MTGLSHPKIAPDGVWTLGVKIGLPFAILFALVLLAGCVGMVIGAFRASDECDYGWSNRKMFRVWSFVPFVLLLAFGGGMVAAYWPFNSSYHQYRQVDGTVAHITSRLLSAGDSGGGTDQKFVVTFKGSPQQFGINDTRAALVRPGDTITISCIRSFQYGATDGYDCNWGKP